MSARLPVAIDVMGGDAAPHAIVEGAMLARARGVAVVLVGDAGRVRPLLPDDVDLVHAPDVIGMDDSPLDALRRKPDASIAIAMRLLEEGRAGAVVSCGNTGAVVVAAIRALGTEDDVERVAVAAELPTADGGTLLVLDAGASVDVRAAHLVGFARLGIAWAQARGIPDPRLAILSNGEEPSKGTQLVRDTLEAATEAGLEMAPMEPGPALSGRAHVLVTDGFTGNVLIKSVEAAATTVLQLLAASGSKDPVHAPSLSWRHRGGGRLLGVPGVVIIGHGRADAVAVASTIEQAWHAIS